MKAFKSSALRRGFLKGAALAAALAGISSIHADSIVNGDFESGLSSWTESGGSGLFSTPESITGFYDSIIPPNSGHFGLISNNGVESNSISQTFTVTDSFLLFSYRFVTDEYNTGVDFNDAASVTLTVSGNPTTLLSIARNDLQAGGEGSLLAGAGYIDNTQRGYDIGHDSWRSFAFDVSAFAGQSATLTFSISNAGDSTADIGVSHLAVDNVRTSAIPEPSTYAILTVAGLLFLVRRHRLRA